MGTRFASVWALVALLLLLAAAPAGADPPSGGETPDRVEQPEGSPSSLGEGASPGCEDQSLDPTTKRNCERSHSISRPYPLSSYGIDNNVDVGVRNLADVLPLSVHWLLGIIWQCLLWLFNSIILMLEWTFSLDLVGDSMASVREALAHFNDEVLGEAWILAGISIAGLWGIWNGLMRLRTTETAIGLATVVLMMVGALLIIHQPAATVGQLSAISNQASVDALSLASSGKVKDGANGFADASQKLFNTMMLEPWCALEFGDVSYCYERPGKVCKIDPDDSPEPERPASLNPNPGAPPLQCKEFDGTIADAWLSYPAGSKERVALWRGLKEMDPGKARIQGADGTMDRVGLLLLIAIGVSGCAALMIFLGVKLVFTGVGTLALLLATPAVLILPAFGEAGRKAFILWLKRLAGFTVGELVYAFFFAVVILIGGLIAGLDGIGWHAKWVILIGFYWGAYFRREEMIGFVAPTNQRSGGLLGNLYHGAWVAGAVGGAITAAPRRVARAGTGGVRRVREHVVSRRRARERALSHDARQELRRQGTAELGQRRAQDNQEAERLLRQAAADRRRKSDMRGEVRSADGELAQARRRRDVLHRKAQGTTDPDARAAVEQELKVQDRTVARAEAKRNRLVAEREDIDNRLDDPRLGWAQATARRNGGRNEVAGHEIRDWTTRREADLSQSAPSPDDDDRDRAHRSLMRRASSPESLSRAERRAVREELRADPDRARAVDDRARSERRAERRVARDRGRRRGMGRR